MMNSGIHSGFSPFELSLKAAEIAEAVHEFETAYPMFAGVPIEDMLAGTGDIKCELRCLGDDVAVTITAPLYGIVFTWSY